MNGFDFEEYINNNSSSEIRDFLAGVTFDLATGKKPIGFAMNERNAKIICQIYDLAEVLK